MIRHTLAKEISDHWLVALKKLAVSREQARGEDAIELPPEFIRVLNIAVRNYSAACFCHSFLAFRAAKDFATDLVIGTREICSLVTLTRTGRNPDGNKYQRKQEFAVYPGRIVPQGTSDIRVSKPLVLTGIINGKK